MSSVELAMEVDFNIGLWQKYEKFLIVRDFLPLFLVINLWGGKIGKHAEWTNVETVRQMVSFLKVFFFFELIKIRSNFQVKFDGAGHLKEPELSPTFPLINLQLCIHYVTYWQHFREINQKLGISDKCYLLPQIHQSQFKRISLMVLLEMLIRLKILMPDIKSGCLFFHPTIMIQVFPLRNELGFLARKELFRKCSLESRSEALF